MSPTPVSPYVSNPNESRQVNIVVCAVITWLIAATFVGLRFFTRGRIIHVLGAEDWVLVGALFFSALTSAGAIEQACYGEGKHWLDVDRAYYSALRRAGWYTFLWFLLSMLCVKISLILLYLRVLTYHYARYAVKVILVLVVLHHIYGIVVFLTACVPLPAYWDPSVKAVYCHPRSVFWASTGLHMATDLLIYALPIPVIFQMKTPARQKLALYCLFAFGFIACLTSIFRLVSMLNMNYARDTTWVDAGMWMWTCIELNTAITCACIMTMKPLLQKMFPRLHLFGTGRTESPANLEAHGAPLTIGSKPSRLLTPENKPQDKPEVETVESVDATERARNNTPVYQQQMALKNGYFLESPSHSEQPTPYLSGSRPPSSSTYICEGDNQNATSQSDLPAAYVLQSRPPSPTINLWTNDKKLSWLV